LTVTVRIFHFLLAVFLLLFASFVSALKMFLKKYRYVLHNVYMEALIALVFANLPFVSIIDLHEIYFDLRMGQ
jgi:hypothetical protein